MERLVLFLPSLTIILPNSLTFAFVSLCLVTARVLCSRYCVSVVLTGPLVLVGAFRVLVLLSAFGTLVL
jgi:hypothetical protein